MSTKQEFKEMKIMLFGILGLGVAWMLQPLAARIASVPLGSPRWTEAFSNPALIWGIDSYLTRFWIADAWTWLAAISCLLAGIFMYNLKGEDEDVFTLTGNRRVKWSFRNPVNLALVAWLIFFVGAISLELGIPAGLILGIALAVGPVTYVVILNPTQQDKLEDVPGDRIMLGLEDTGGGA
jgi:hypothetical protein